MSYGKEVYLVEMEGKDANEIGFEQFLNTIEQTNPLNLKSLLEKKLQLMEDGLVYINEANLDTDITLKYIDVENNSYLEYKDPEIIYTVSIYVSSGSVVTYFTVNSNIPINKNVSLPISVNLDLIGGGDITIGSTVIIPKNETSGQTISTNPALNYSLLTKTGEVFIQPIDIDFPLNILVNELQFEQEPTPTPTPTPT